MEQCYVVVHNAQKQHIVAVCKGIENAETLTSRLNQRVGADLYKIIVAKFIW